MRLSALSGASVLIVVLAAPALPGGPPEPRGSTLEIPTSARGLRNPVRPNDDAIRAGRGLWRAHCETCHGTGGRGDGPNARLHEMRKHVRPQDLTNAAVQEALTDGELFWRITNGILEEDAGVIMPAYRDKIPREQQRWQLVLYVRYLGGAVTASK
jgi:mono/diheme cytochrome c family protein